LSLPDQDIVVLTVSIGASDSVLKFLLMLVGKPNAAINTWGLTGLGWL
jgi:hypothetical protein